jgi:hypothetical protein
VDGRCPAARILRTAVEVSAAVLLCCCAAVLLCCCVAECVVLYLLVFESAFRRAGAAVVWLVLFCTCWHFEGAELSEG